MENQDAFLTALQDKLLNQADMISSASTGLESKISEAISGVQKAGAASTAKIESEFGRELGYQKEQFAENITSGRAAGSGGILNMAALRALTETTDKSLKDLEQRKQELILQGESATASKISELQIKSLEFRQQAEQQSFSNLFNMGQFSLNVQAENRAKEQFSQTIEFQKSQQAFEQSSKMATIQLEYGLTSIPGESLSSLITRAQPRADAKRRAELAKLLKDAKADESKVNATSGLWEEIRDRGMSAGAAANTVAANVQVMTGTKLTVEQFNAIQKESEQIYSDWTKERDRVKAEEEGRGTWGIIDAFFGPSKTLELQQESRQKYAERITGIPTYESPAFITNLFNQ